MPTFSFTVRDAGGALRDGVLEGTNPAAVADQLIEGGATPIRIEALRDAARPAEPFPWPWRRAKVQHEELLLFSRQLHSLLKAGIPIVRALTGLQESASPAMAAVVGQTRQSLQSGNALSMSMARQRGVFSPFYIAMVRVGELTGRLDEVFLRLFHHLAFERLMRDQVRSAVRYPSFVLVVMGLAIEVVNLFVIPAFQKTFETFGAELPLMTRVLVGFSKFCLVGWPYMLAAGLAAGFGFRAWTATPAGRCEWDRLRLRLPIAGKILRKATLARFARSFALALKSGLPMVQSLSVVSATVENEYIGGAIDRMRAGVERGDSLLRTAAASRIFTPVVLQMIAVGEEAGALEEMLAEVADFYQQDVEYELKTLTAQIEPILIVFLGVLVMILALGVFLPVWNLGHVGIKR
jgi:MSHA biogenesis protein MshG